MTQLSDFSPEETALIISLPYRVGMHVSYADDEHGENDDELEMKALAACIKEVVRQHEGEPLTKEIALEILSNKDKWSNWEQGVFNIEPQCETAVSTLKIHANSSEVKDYIKMILDVASSVAQAYGEFGEGADQVQGLFGKISGIVKSVVSVGVDDASHPMNVSAAEDTAISNIATALKKNMK